jgi:small subunit ribosomal protein S6
MMNHYETLFVIRPTLTEEEIKSQIEKVKGILEKEGAELIATDDMGMRKLAYPVQKNSRGYYTVLFYKTKGDTIAELERNLKINEEVIKFLTVKYTKTKEIAQFNKLVAAANKKSQPAEPAKTVEPAEPAKTVESAEAAKTVEPVEDLDITDNEALADMAEEEAAIEEAKAAKA